MNNIVSDLHNTLQPERTPKGFLNCLHSNLFSHTTDLHPVLRWDMVVVLAIDSKVQNKSIYRVALIILLISAEV